MTDPIDIDELRAGLRVTAATTPPRLRLPRLTWPRYGHERTFGELAMAIEYAREEVVKDMTRARDPVLQIAEGESDADAFARIGAETQKRWLTDRRMVLLANKWGAETMVEAYRRKLAFSARWSQAYRDSSITHFPDSDTLRATLRLATGLEDPLPSTKARHATQGK